MVAINFNATGVKPNAALEAVPSGQYPVMITASSMKPTKNGRGQYIELEMTIQGGEFDKRKLFDRLNIVNDSQTAVDIAYSTLSALCHVCNRMEIQQTEQIHGIPFIAVAIKKERDDQPGSFSNEVKGYKDINGNDPGFAGNTQGGGNGNPSWANNNGGGQQQQNQNQNQNQNNGNGNGGGQQSWQNNNGGNNNGNGNMNGGAGQIIEHQNNGNGGGNGQGQVQQPQTQQTQQSQQGQPQQPGGDTPPWARGGN